MSLSAHARVHALPPPAAPVRLGRRGSTIRESTRVDAGQCGSTIPLQGAGARFAYWFDSFIFPVLFECFQCVAVPSSGKAGKSADRVAPGVWQWEKADSRGSPYPKKKSILKIEKVSR